MQHLDHDQLHAPGHQRRRPLRPPSVYAHSHAVVPQSLTQKIEKNSPTLGRNADYTAASRLSRIPSYLTVHMVRFAWRTDIGKKAKIMVRPHPPIAPHPPPPSADSETGMVCAVAAESEVPDGL